MQLTNALDDDQFIRIEIAIQSERLSRYMPAAKNEKKIAFQYYLWNCKLSEAFYFSLHFAEVVCRNAIHRQLVHKLGSKWYEHSTLKGKLAPRFQVELHNAVSGEWSQHREQMTEHHVVSALTFGFWEHLTTKRFERLIWSRGISHRFPGAPPGMKPGDLHDLIESVRRWRNRIAHHQAIFDKGPTRKHQDAMNLIKWVCGDTATWVGSISTVPQIVAQRPQS